MKIFIILAATGFVALASANGYGSNRASHGASQGARYGSSGTGPAGHSSQFRSEDNYGNYKFGYDESHAYGGSSRREEGSGHTRRGSYSLSDADGRRRTVDYVADHTGFHAKVRTNEPGVEAEDPADVYINKEEHNVVAAPAYAPAAPAYAPAAPLAAGPTSAAPIRSYGAPAYSPAPAHGTAPAYAAESAYPPTPRAFSYSFESTHISPAAYAPAPAAAPQPLAEQAYGQAY